jgi:glycosyltransferase involved in cell wall biosynthesis
MKENKVLHVISVSFSINYFFGNQFNYLGKKDKTEYHLACTPSKEFLNLSKTLNFIPFEVEITRKISPLKDLIAIYKIFKYIKIQNITHVVGHTPKGGMIAMVASFLAGTKQRIYFRHGLLYETSKGLKRILLKSIEKFSGTLANKVICVSKSILELSEIDRLNRPSKNILLGLGTCNGVDTEIKYNPNNYDFRTISIFKSKLNITEQDFVIGFVGRLVADKGINQLIDSWDIIKAKYKNVKLLLVGPIEERDSISDYSKNRIATDPTIIFTNFVSDASIYYSLINVFILPSYREGFPTVVLEASSMGIPVLTTKATGCIESIIEGKTGDFITHDSKNIASKIGYYIENRDIAILQGKNGRAFVCEHFEQTKVWDSIFENYK